MCREKFGVIPTLRPWLLWLSMGLDLYKHKCHMCILALRSGCGAEWTLCSLRSLKVIGAYLNAGQRTGNGSKDTKAATTSANKYGLFVEGSIMQCGNRFGGEAAPKRKAQTRFKIDDQTLKGYNQRLQIVWSRIKLC